MRTMSFRTVSEPPDSEPPNSIRELALELGVPISVIWNPYEINPKPAPIIRIKREPIVQ